LTTPPEAQATPLPAPGTRRALQDRSRRTQERILCAAERLLRRRLLEQLTVAEVAREARVSVGAFYARFEGKQALVPALGERYAAAVDRYSAELLDPARWDGLDLRQRLRRLVRLAVRTYLRNRGVIRALSLQWRESPEQVLTPSLRARRVAFVQRQLAVLLPASSEIRHPDPEAAARFALQVLGATLRDVLLVQPGHPHPTDLDERDLTRSLAHSLYATLTLAPAPRP
jgi:AcrR family transcriptional regulator